jgi:hypothetical protein
MKKKMGRPKLPKGEAKGVQFGIRLSKPDGELVKEAIKRSGLSQPDWLRNALLSAAKNG